MSVTGTRTHHIYPLPRPGVFYGRYPSRSDGEKGFMDSIAQRLQLLFKAANSKENKACKMMLERVAVIEESASRMNEKTFAHWVDDVKRKLHTRGLQEELVASAFSIVREAASRILGMKHYDCQLTAGWMLLHQKIVEMETGEGKTLTATLPAACAAMAGMPVHVVTVNDYLVRRDADLMTPLYTKLGLSVGCVVEGMSNEERTKAYQCDITYCTSKQLAFDYLRDRLVLKQFHSELVFKLESLYSSLPTRDELLLRGLNFVIVDEADSVFIDEARTPLILSYMRDNKEQEEVHREAVWLASQMHDSGHYMIDEKLRRVELTTHGKEFLDELSTSMRDVWQGERMRSALVEQALSALHLYIKDVHYLVKDGEVNIIDENTGRTMPDRSWEAGLHQMIEEKEGCEQSGRTETLGRTSYQQFFRRYLRLSGMTGTGSEERSELEKIYELPVKRIPTNRPAQRICRPELIYATKDAKWTAIVNSVITERAYGRPILIGTRTVKDSEYVDDLLTAAGLKHQVLNARQDEDEATIIARAGHYGQVTVATNMAGRGTDIKLDKGARAAGGLHVICCERNVSGRIDRQLAGRCGRQGDPGSYQAILSLDDMLLENMMRPLVGILKSFALDDGLVRPMWLARFITKVAQKLTEREYRAIRKTMMHVDKKREAMLAFSGTPE